MAITKLGAYGGPISANGFTAKTEAVAVRPPWQRPYIAITLGFLLSIFRSI